MNTSDQEHYKIQFSNEPEYLSAYVTGKKNQAETAKQFWHAISEECKKVGCKKVLVVEDMQAKVSLSEVYSIASELPQLFHGIQVAFVDKHSEHQNLNDFGETVATNRGFHGKVFNDVEAAKEWLLSQTV